MAGTKVSTYDPGLVVPVFKGNQLNGFSPDALIKVKRNEKAFTMTVGVDGDVVRNRMRDKTGTVEISLLPGSPSNATLYAIAAADEESDGDGVGEFMLKDLNNQLVVISEEAWIEQVPDLEYAKQVGVSQWVLALAKVRYVRDDGTV